jgi:hypothetical protein
MLDVEICTTSEKLCSFELRTIVYHNPFGHAESIYDALQELDRCLLGYIHYWHGFYPLSERVNSNKQISEATWCPRQDAYDVDSPDYRRPGDINRMKRIGMLHRLLLEELSISAFLYDFHCVILHCGLVKSMLKHFLNDRAL